MAALVTSVVVLSNVVFFNGMGSTRAQGLRYASTVDTLKDGKLFYRGEEQGEKFFKSVFPAEDFDDIIVEDVGTGIVRGEPVRASTWRRYFGVKDPEGFVYRLILHRWFPPCSQRQVQKGLDDVRAALAVHEEILIYGNSRGAALALMVVSQLAPEEQARVKGVISEAPFDRLSNVVADRYALPDFLRFFLEFVLPAGPLDYSVPDTVPVLIGSGTEDDSCPPQGQLRLKQHIPHAELHVVKGANHNDIWLDPGFRAKVKAFIECSPKKVFTASA